MGPSLTSFGTDLPLFLHTLEFPVDLLQRPLETPVDLLAAFYDDVPPVSRVKHCCRLLLPHSEMLPKNQHLGSPTVNGISGIPTGSVRVVSDAA